MKLALLATSLVAIAMSFAPGCTSDSRSGGSGPMTFVAAAPSEGASVFLRGQPADASAPNRITVDVVARGAAALHGAAFRVTWDPEALGFAFASGGPPWSKQAIAMAKEGSPGELAVVWAEKGETGIDASGETVIGTLTFDVHGRKGTALEFKAERSQLADKTGARLDAKWLGGTIAAR